MKIWFRNRGYKEEDLDKQIYRSRQILRAEVLVSKRNSNKKKNSIPLILDFHPALSKIPSVLEELPFLSSCSHTKNVFPEELFVSHCRPNNLKDTLVHAKLPSGQVNLDQTGMYSCNKCRCQICKFVFNGRVFSDFATRNRFYVNYHFNCGSAGFVYLLYCK